MKVLGTPGWLSSSAASNKRNLYEIADCYMYTLARQATGDKSGSEQGEPFLVNWAFNRVVDRAGVQGGSRARRRHRCVWLCTRVTTASVTEPRMLTPTHHVAVVAACCADLKQAKDVAVGGPSMRSRLRERCRAPRSAPRRRVRKIAARGDQAGVHTRTTLTSPCATQACHQRFVWLERLR